MYLSAIVKQQNCIYCEVAYISVINAVSSRTTHIHRCTQSIHTYTESALNLSKLLSLDVLGKHYGICSNRRTTYDDNTENAAGKFHNNPTKLLDSKIEHQIQAWVAFSV